MSSTVLVGGWMKQKHCAAIAIMDLEQLSDGKNRKISI
ncbi:hypothetical protein SORDD21_01816 [Streptococcus oralis]|uniref:Uncharacterized protein n=1 Tax=Streptococcus oralis TaxID=1303 RepID=A0A139PH19_STROR|nr:hypothetical protein SORDD21_01816 [Streptococcus oralis]